MRNKDKFNNVVLLSSQDTAVWRFVTKSTNFKGLECFTVQVFERNRQMAKALYQYYSRQEHPFDNYKRYMENNGARLPSFIVYEKMWIENYARFVNRYVEYYEEVDQHGSDGCEGEICRVVAKDTGTCLSCLFSRSDKNKIDYFIRICNLGHTLNDVDCMNKREEFLGKIKIR